MSRTTPMPLLVLALLPACGEDTDATASATGGASSMAVGQGGSGQAGGATGAGGGTGGSASSTGGAGGSGGAALGMSFFVTSAGNGVDGGNYGGVSGADARCQSLADSAGAGARVWHAYLSTEGLNGGIAVDARDRIGTGPWHNQQGALVAEDLDQLHTVGLAPANALDEMGGPPDDEIPGDEHDILTGSTEQGTVIAGRTCNDWTSSDATARVQVGHHDWSIIPNPISPNQSWNSVHDTRCDPSGLMQTLGSGKLYCFASDSP